MDDFNAIRKYLNWLFDLKIFYTIYQNEEFLFFNNLNFDSEKIMTDILNDLELSIVKRAITINGGLTLIVKRQFCRQCGKDLTCTTEKHFHNEENTIVYCDMCQDIINDYWEMIDEQNELYGEEN